jgi:hypothetical protein
VEITRIRGNAAVHVGYVDALDGKTAIKQLNKNPNDQQRLAEINEGPQGEPRDLQGRKSEGFRNAE